MGTIVGFPPVDGARVAIATPVYDHIETETEDCLRQLEILSGNSGVPCLRVRAHGTYIQRTRNEIAYRVRQMEMGERPTHILWVDADMTFHEGALLRLLDWEVPIVGGLYRGRSEVGNPIVGRKNDRGIWETTKLYADLHAALANEEYLYEKIDHVGTGFMLVDIRVFDRLERPWFRVVDDDVDNELGEDAYFCAQAKAAGIEVAVDLGCQCGHIGKKTYDVDDFWRRFERWLKDRAATKESASVAAGAG